MSYLAQIFNIFSFVTLMSVPTQPGVRSDGSIVAVELFDFVRWMLDYSVRVVSLFSVGLAVEYLFGDAIYEAYRTDYALLIIAGVGTFHWLCFYGCFRYLRSNKVTMLFYRLIRNFCFALILATLALLPVLAFELFSSMEAFESGLFEVTFVSVCLIAAALGALEAVFKKGQPTGFSFENNQNKL